MKKNDTIRIGCVILAAGNSARFKSNKLFAQIDGKSMIERAFDAIPKDKLCCVTVVTQYERIRELADKYGFDCVINSRPDLGLSHSVKLGTQALMDSCDGILYQVSDQPRLKRENVAKMLDRFIAHPDRIVSMCSGGRRGNPCVFPKVYFDELCQLSGDTGGRTVIEKHEDDLILFEVPPEELVDIDTPDDALIASP